MLTALLIAAWVVTCVFGRCALGFLLTVLAVAAMAVRYQGRLMGLLILALSAVMTARYFYLATRANGSSVSCGRFLDESGAVPCRRILLELVCMERHRVHLM